MDGIKEIGMQIVGSVALVLFGWLGWNKARKVANTDGGGADVIDTLREELTRIAGQLKELSAANADLQKQILKEREDCSREITELKQKVAELEYSIKEDQKTRASERQMRQKGLLKTRRSDRG